jgi:hypothetical protein
MKTRKNITWKVAAMVVALSLMSAPVFAQVSYPSLLLAKKPLVRPSYIVLYNNSGQDVYDAQVFKLMYVDVNGFYHWEKIAEVASIPLHTQVAVRVPSGAGLSVRYCVGQDGCSMYDQKSTGSFGPVPAGYSWTITLY